ncbi:VWA domain-containing protein [bacterium]|nr:VWA domain-containing protein [candidate division CSSED10-310 bacterium]
MKIRFITSVGIAWFCVLFPSVLIYAQTPPHINVQKELLTTGEICPGAIIDISIRLTGSGSTALLRYPVNTVCVIDKSGSMAFGGYIGWNPTVEPPYGNNPPFPTPPIYSPTPTPRPNPPYYPVYPSGNSPYVQTIWASWKFFKYFVDNPPKYGYDDFGGLLFYGSLNHSYPSYNLPGLHPVLTPVPIQRVRDDPTHASHKNFWWSSHLAIEPCSGGTAMGPAMQVARDVIGSMPLHVPSYTSETPTPVNTQPDYDAPNFMLLMSDGRPNDSFASGPGEVPPWPDNAYAHAIEMARRCSLKSPYGAYTQTWDTTIFTLGLGSEVDTLLMTMLSDPWNPAYWSGTPRPSQANYGFFSWALTESDLIDTFEAIAGHIVSNLAGSDIEVLEIVPGIGGVCPGGETVLTEIVENSWNYPPTVIPPETPGDSPSYTWNFNELLIGDEVVITFQMAVPTGAPLNTPSLIECPDSSITYNTYLGDSVSYGIDDPGFEIGECNGPTSTPTPTPTPTSTPTCIQQTLFFDDFETGDFSLWDNAVPTWGVEVYDSSSYAHQGDQFAFFAGSEESSGFGSNESYMFKILSFNNPIRPGANLEFYVRLKGFIFPQKGVSNGLDDPQAYDLFIVEVTDENSHFWFHEYSFFDQQDDYFQVRVPLYDFAGSETVRIRLISNYPVTVHDPDPWDNSEPMVFVDDFLVFDYCYEPTPTPTSTPPPQPSIPATSSKGIGITLLIIGLLIAIPVIRRTI